MTVTAGRTVRWAWICVILIPVGIVLAFVIGETLPGLLGYGWTHEGALPIGPMLLVAIPTQLLFVVPGLLAAWFGFRARAHGDTRGLAPAVIGLVASGYFALSGLMGLIGLLL